MKKLLKVLLILNLSFSYGAIYIYNPNSIGNEKGKDIYYEKLKFKASQASGVEAEVSNEKRKIEKKKKEEIKKNEKEFTEYDVYEMLVKNYKTSIKEESEIIDKNELLKLKMGITKTKESENINNANLLLKPQATNNYLFNIASFNTLRGYCYLDKKLKVISDTYFRVKCYLKDEREVAHLGELFGRVHLDYRNLKVEFIPLEFREKNKSYKVVGKVFKEDRMTDNIADKVNRRMLEKATALGISTFLSSSASAYREYALNNQVDVYMDDNRVVSKKSVDKDYPLLYGALEGANAFVQSIADMIKSESDRMPYMFIINPQKLYVELQVKK